MRPINTRHFVLSGLWLSALSSIALFAIALLWHLGVWHAEEDSQAEPFPEPHSHITAVEPPPTPPVEPKNLIEQNIPPPQQDKQPNNDKPTKSTIPLISIIIDDLGYQWKSGIHSIQLEGDYTLAILPFSPYSTKLAVEAKKFDKEVMLHAPMEPIAHHTWDKHQGLGNTMDQASLQASLARMLKDVPHAKGVNNHMGSALTQNVEAMNWLMEDIGARNLYFIDSVTTSLSQAYSAAQRYNIPSQKRDIFLDNTRNYDAIEIQFNKLIKRAQKYGSAIGICHPYPETIAFLQGIHPKFKEHNVRLVPITTLLSRINKQNHQKEPSKHVAQAPKKPAPATPHSSL